MVTPLNLLDINVKKKMEILTMRNLLDVNEYDFKGEA